MKNSPSHSILIVEDEVIVARDIRLQVEQLGYEVLGETRTGEEAIALTRTLNPDLVLMDIQLGGRLNGIEAGKVIIEETGKPLVFLTAFASGELFEAAKTLSPAGYVLKPFEERELRIVLEMAFYKQQVEYELRLKSNALSAAANAVVITDRNGRIEWANNAFSLCTGYSQAEAIGRKTGDLLKSGRHPPEFYRDMWETIARGEIWNNEIINKRKDGSLYHERMTITPLHAPNGEISHYIAIKQDITEEKSLEKLYLRAQRMESVGTLAGGIAHDLNNILSPILMSCDLLLKEPLPEDDLQMVQLIHECADRGANIVRQVLTFARGEEAPRSEVQLRHLILERCKTARETFPKNITVIENIPRDLWTVSVDPTQIHQVIMNLMLNARDAMPDGGTLTLSGSNRHITQAEIPPDSSLKPGPCAVITVSDNGTGIAEDNLSRIFEPFFTTKPHGKGSGLGLHTVQTILTKHHGALKVESRPGQGSSFSIYLPASEGPFEASTAETAAALPHGKGETVLVVDDEDSIRWMIRSTLKSLGYRAELARNGEEALKKLHKMQSPPCSLILLDLMMPAMDGPQLIAQLRKDGSKTPILVMSGIIPQNSLEKVPDLKDLPFLQKPFSIADLAKSVAEQVTGAPQSPADL